MALLTVAPSSFVGRRQQLNQLHELLKAARLVTVCGPPGIGKTRTALELLRQRPGASLVLDLAVVSDDQALDGVLARQLQLAPNEDACTALAARVGEDTLLLVDNAEVVVQSLSDRVLAWLAAAPRLRVLVTTRERLRLAGERVVELGPLALDDDAGELPEAVELFLDRLRDGLPDLTLSDDDRAAVRRIVKQLEGIPLAIELAAARAPALGLALLEQRLDEQLPLLSRGLRGAPNRQATLRGAIDWSWQLLNAEQQRGLAACAVFRGPFDVEAAEAVLGDAALDVLQDLRDRSLLLAPAPGRFDLYASIAEFAAEALDRRPDSEAMRMLHARHYIERGEALARAFEREGAPLEPLLTLHDNLLRATRASMAAGERELAARGCVALSPVFRTRGPLELHLALLDAALEELDDEPELLRARGLARGGLGQLAQAEADMLAALDSCDDDWLRAAARKDLGVLYHQQRDVDRARVCYEAALTIARAIGDRRSEGVVIGNLGALDHDIGRFEQALASYQRALELLRAAGDRRLEAIFITNLGVLEQEQGRRSRAADCYRNALALLERAPDLRFEGIALGNLGVMEHEAGRLSEARSLHERALACLQRVGERQSLSLCHARLGAALAEEGALAAADEQLRTAEQLADGLGARLVRLHRCFLDLAKGDEEAAHAGVAEAQRTSGTGPRLVDVNDDARVALRMLGQRLAGNGAPQLELADDASWFRVPGGSRQSLTKYSSARRILARLAEVRLEDPGHPVDADELFEVGWPGVSIGRRSAMNRLFVALAKLRKLGLKLLLLRREDGYLLDPDTPVVRMPDDAHISTAPAPN